MRRILILLTLAAITTADPLVKTVTVTTTAVTVSSLMTFPTGQSHYVREITVQVETGSANPVRLGECPTCTTPVSSSNGIQIAASTSFRIAPGQPTQSINLDKLGIVAVGGSATATILAEYGNTPR